MLARSPTTELPATSPATTRGLRLSLVKVLDPGEAAGNNSGNISGNMLSHTQPTMSPVHHAG